jgi:hypothetical protein
MYDFMDLVILCKYLGLTKFLCSILESCLLIFKLRHQYVTYSVVNCLLGLNYQ